MKFFTALSLLFMSSFASAGTLSIPNEFEFLAVNGEEISDSLFSKTREVDLPVGEQRIAIRYKATVRDDIGDGSTRLESLVIIITLQVEANTDYLVSPSVKLTTFKKANAYANHPTIFIKTTSGDSADFKIHLPSVEDYGVIGNALNKERKTTATVALQGTQKNTTLASDSPAKTTDNTAEKMLHHWWNEADDKTKRAFTDFVNKEPIK